MKTAIFIILFSLASHALACELEENEILGAYIYIGGDVLFEEFSIEAGGKFNSWLHHRPESVGRWQLSGCTVVIQTYTSDPVRLKFISLTPTEAIIQTDGIDEYGKYKRM